MRSETDAVRREVAALDDVLESLRLERDAAWRDTGSRTAPFASHVATDLDFADHAASICASTKARASPQRAAVVGRRDSVNGKPDGAGGDHSSKPRAVGGRDKSRSADRIKQRVLQRESEWTRRTALDLQRLADLDERMRVRQAEATRRRWFVLGRLLMEAARVDPRWDDIIERLVRTRALSADEARALGLTKRKS